MSKNIIIANWKMNPANLAEARKLFGGIKASNDAEVVVCPPFAYLAELKGGVKLGGQDCSWEEKGAYTGDISAKMLKNVGAEYVILGHSERRRYHNETYVIINRKIAAAQKAGLKVILCIENIAQLKRSLSFKNLIVAYEPTFAIGSGKPCDPIKARSARELIQKNVKNSAILYGGSTNAGNAKRYIEEAGFNGLLVGGASLDVKEFNALINEIN